MTTTIPAEIQAQQQHTRGGFPFPISIDEKGRFWTNQVCDKCGGAGGADAWKHTGWTCYRCGGNGVDPKPLRLYTAEEQAKRELAAQKRAERKVAKADAVRDATRAQYPEAVAILDGELQHHILTSIRCQLANKGEITEKQAALVVKIAADEAEYLARKAEEAANAQPLPTGKAIVVEGEVVTTKIQEGEYGSTFKMLVKGQGWAIWSTVPRQVEGKPDQQDRSLIGQRIRFVADVEASRNDPAFGIAKRPRKAEVVG